MAKLCEACKETYHDLADTCSACGGSLRQATPEEIREISIVQEKKSDISPEMQNKLNSCGGWLTVFKVIIVFNMLSYLGVIGKSIGQWGSLSTSVLGIILLLVDIAVQASLICININILSNLDRKLSDTPAKIIKMLIILAAIMVAYYLFYYFIFPENEATHNIRSIFSPLVFSTFWIGYFEKSKRVRVYYGSSKC